MRVARRRFDPAELPLGALFGGVLCLAVPAAALWLRLGLPRPGCLFRAWTGLPCPGCGSTRLVEAVLRLDVLTAFLFNPLVFLALTALGGWALFSVARFALRLPAWSLELAHGERRALRVAALAALAGNWIYLALTH